MLGPTSPARVLASRSSLGLRPRYSCVLVNEASLKDALDFGE